MPKYYFRTLLSEVLSDANTYEVTAENVDSARVLLACRQDEAQESGNCEDDRFVRGDFFTDDNGVTKWIPVDPGTVKMLEAHLVDTSETEITLLDPTTGLDHQTPAPAVSDDAIARDADEARILRVAHTLNITMGPNMAPPPNDDIAAVFRLALAFLDQGADDELTAEERAERDRGAEAAARVDVWLSGAKPAERAAIVAKIESGTDYDAATIKFHRDGLISAIKDADKTFSGPHYDRLLVGHIADFANGADPFRA